MGFGYEGETLSLEKFVARAREGEEGFAGEVAKFGVYLSDGRVVVGPFSDQHNEILGVEKGTKVFDAGLISVEGNDVVLAGRATSVVPVRDRQDTVRLMEERLPGLSIVAAD